MKIFVSPNAISMCESCRYGKMYQLHFQQSLIRTKNPLELVYSDIWGPSPILSSASHKYYILFVDCHTRYSWIFPLTLKFEALSTFITFKTQVELQFNIKIRTLQTDLGQEY
ncbi:hypothetical protein ACOSQ3_028702 [Xanthoceras sorbifolium]